MVKRLLVLAATLVVLSALAPAATGSANQTGAQSDEVQSEEAQSEVAQSEDGAAPVITFDPTKVKENSEIGTVVAALGLTGADDEASYTYSLVGGKGGRHNGLFKIVDGEVATAGSLDFEALGPKLKIRVAAVDAVTEATVAEQAFVVTLKDVDDVTVEPATVAENVKLGTVVGTLAIPNPKASVTYSITTGLGHRHNYLFDIVKGKLVTAGSLDYEKRGGSLSVRIAATDATGQVLYENAVTVSLTDVTDIVVEPASVEENVAVGTVVGPLSVSGESSDATYEYSLAKGAGDRHNDTFAIADGQLVTATEVDFETMGASLSIRVKATDPATGKVVYKNAITISLIDLKDEDPEVSAAEQEILDALRPGCDPYNDEFVILRFPQLDIASRYRDSFGDDRDGGERKHRGADIFGEKGTPVVAVADGTVVRYGSGERAGIYVVVRHEDGWETLYIHLNNDTKDTDDGALGLTEALAPGIAPGTQVVAGQLLGWVGDSGNAEDTPAHTHFELWDNDQLAYPNECLDQAWRWQTRVWELAGTIS